MSEVVDEFEGPPGEERLIPLASTGDVERELVKVYRAMRKRRISVADGNGLTQTLQTLSKMMRERMEDAALEKLERLEAQRRGEPPRPTPQAH